MPLTPPQVCLLVDGYNIIGAWSELSKISESQSLEAARDQLVEVLVNYSSFQGFATQVVFDAHYQATGARKEKFTRNLSICYTAFGETADTYIEKICASFYRQPHQRSSRLIVATSDRAHQLTVLGYGAEWLSAQRLAQEVESAARKVKIKKRAPKQSSGRFLINSLDSKSRQRLTELRFGQRF